MKSEKGNHLLRLYLNLFLDLVSSPRAVVTTCVACVDVFLGVKMGGKLQAVHASNICLKFVYFPGILPDLPGILKTGNDLSDLPVEGYFRH